MDPVAPTPQGPVDALSNPRFCGIATFGRLPMIDQVPNFDIAVCGAPFDTGVSYRPGARFGPSAIRQVSRIMRPYHPVYDVFPFKQAQVVDGGDFPCSPFNIQSAIQTIEDRATEVLGDTKGLTMPKKLLTMGGDHTIALPLLRAINKAYGQVTLIHFDAHLDTWDTYFEEPYTHGTPFRRAAEEKLFDTSSAMHIGTRGPIYSPQDLKDDAGFGFSIIRCSDIERLGVDEVINRMLDRINAAGKPVYISIDIDVLDPAFAPGTGTPEIGGMTSRELVELLRGLRDLKVPVVGGDVVECAPAYDHAEITATAASSILYELICLMISQADK